MRQHPKGENTMKDCADCGQPLPQVMSCEEWEQAKIDFMAQFKTGFIEVGNIDTRNTKQSKGEGVNHGPSD